jgi:FAD synthetase
MVRVMATGIFDILHAGHLYFLTEAKKLGDELVVVVATDATARRLKHEPIMGEKMRLEMISALKVVDRAVLGHPDDRYKVVAELKPDIIAIGYDQVHDIAQIEKECRERGLNCRVVRLEHCLSELDGTRKIIKKIVDWWGFQRALSFHETPLKPKITKAAYLEQQRKEEEKAAAAASAQKKDLCS